MKERNSIGYEGLISLIQEIASGVNLKETLLIPEVKESLKQVIDEAGNVAAFIELLKNPADQQYIDNKIIVDGAMDILKAIYIIDEYIFKEMCIYSGFSENQVNVLKENFAKSITNESTATKILFESHAIGNLLIQSPNIKELLQNNPYTENENNLDSFIRYIVGNGLPHVQLEKIARLTIYQKQQLENDLANNLKFKKAFEQYMANGELSKSQLDDCTAFIKGNCILNMQETPIQITTKNGIPCARLSHSIDIDDSFFENKSPPGWPDAFGVYKGHADIYSVTVYENFSTQQSQSLNHAYALNNGIISGELNGVKSFESVGWCDSIVGDDKYKNFNNQLAELLSQKIIDKEDFNSFKAHSIHTEALKQIRYNSSEKLNMLAGKHALGLFSDKNFLFKIKKDTVQYEMSFKSLQRAIKVMEKIVEKNPPLYLIGTAYSRAFSTIAYGFKCAIDSKHSQDSKYSDAIKDCQKSLHGIWKKLELIDSNAAKDLMLSREPDWILDEQYKTYDDLYKNHQESLINGTKSIHEQLVDNYIESSKETKNYSIDLYTYFGQNRTKTVDAIFELKYNRGVIGQPLMEHALHNQIDYISDNPATSLGRTGRDRVHKASFKFLVKGLYTAYNNGYKIDSSIERLKSNKDLVDCFIYNDKNDPRVEFLKGKFHIAHVKKPTI